MRLFIGFVVILLILVEISHAELVAANSRGRKQFDLEEDGFFDDFGFKKGQYNFGEKLSDFADIRSNVPGEPGIDYPIYLEIPKTTFSCTGRNQGYYADEETGCQAFHVCDADQVLSFLCPVGSLFSQRLLTCDWWNKVPCSQSREFYNIQSDLNKISFTKNQKVSNYKKVYNEINVYKNSPIITIATLPKNHEHSSLNGSTSASRNQQSIMDATQEIIVDDMEGKESIGLISAHSELGYAFTTVESRIQDTTQPDESEQRIVKTQTQNIHNLSGFKLNQYKKYSVNYHTHYLPDTFLKYQNNQRSTANDHRNIINNENEDHFKNFGIRVFKNNQNAHRINYELQQGKPINLLWTMSQAITNTETLPRPFTNENDSSNNNKMADESFNVEDSSTEYFEPSTTTLEAFSDLEFIPSLSFDFSNDQEKRKYYENFQQNVSKSV